MTDSNEVDTKKSERSFKISRVICKCYMRFLEWKDWMCDPDGPTVSRILFGLFAKTVGFVSIIIGFYTITLTFMPDSLAFSFFATFDGNSHRYIASAMMFFGITCFIRGKHNSRVESKTAVYNEDIDALISEVKSRFNLLPSDELKDETEKQLSLLEKFKNKPSEVSQLRLLPLSKLTVETYNDIDRLKEILQADLHEYRYFVGDDYHEYVRYKNRIDKIIEEYECSRELSAGRREGIIAELQTISKTLRSEIISENFLSGYGEALLESITHWAIIAIPAMFLAGVSPLFAEPYLHHSLTFIHWSLLGMSGAALYTVAKMRQRDASTVAADEGAQELRNMLLSMILGAVTAVLFYMAIKGGWFGGKALPKLNSDVGGEQSIIVKNVLSVIWGVAAGYSAKFLDKIVGASEKAT